MSKVLSGQYISDEIYSGGHFNKLGVLLLEDLKKKILVDELNPDTSLIYSLQ